MVVESCFLVILALNVRPECSWCESDEDKCVMCRRETVRKMVLYQRMIYIYMREKLPVLTVRPRGFEKERSQYEWKDGEKTRSEKKKLRRCKGSMTEDGGKWYKPEEGGAL